MTAIDNIIRIDLKLQETTIFVYKNLTEDELKQLMVLTNKPFEYHAVFYTKSVEEIPDCGFLNNNYIFQPVYIGNYEDIDDVIEEYIKPFRLSIPNLVVEYCYEH